MSTAVVYANFIAERKLEELIFPKTASYLASFFKCGNGNGMK